MEEEIKIMEFIDTQVVSYKFKNNKRLFDGDIRGITDARKPGAGDLMLAILGGDIFHL